ncbi:MAG: hypothetical protein EOM85_01885 [Candidatus Moranbacteria bacterium]|nr:hypothetical protein [Candidatus Moranbacteria bacterium]
MEKFMYWARRIFVAIIIIGGLMMVAKTCSDGLRTNKFEGYLIGPNHVEWVWIKAQDCWYHKETVKVFLTSGEIIEAEISGTGYSYPYCVKYRDYPPAQGKRVKVFGTESYGKYVIHGGYVEE